MKTVGIILCFCLALSAQAQEFKPFKVNVSAALAYGTQSNSQTGLALSIEPRYGINDHLDLGLRIESAFLSRPIDLNGAYYRRSDVKTLTSATLTATYFFTTGYVRPFVGVGVGTFTIQKSEVVVVNDQINRGYYLGNETKIGYLLRAGAKIGHFMAALELNPIAGSSLSQPPVTLNQANAYGTIKVGFDLGGGRRSK